MRAEDLWTPILGELLNLRPCDIADLTPLQWEQVSRYIKQRSKGG